MNSNFSAFLALALAVAPTAGVLVAADKAPVTPPFVNYKIALDTIHRGYDGQY
jgi:hypothetical protein